MPQPDGGHGVGALAVPLRHAAQADAAFTLRRSGTRRRLAVGHRRVGLLSIGLLGVDLAAAIGLGITVR